MKCCNCGSNHWENVDKYRFKPKKEDGTEQGMSICTSCGFVSYPSKWVEKSEIIKHYEDDYRKPPTVFNAFTGQRKNHFHGKFLQSTFEKWKEEGKTSPRVLEIGAAFGMTLQFVKQLFPDAEIHGTELTKSYVNNAWHEFGIDLKPDFDDTLKYDLIIHYKVLEHMLDPHLELQRYSKCLSEDGLMYMSVPTWFNVLTNFGMDGFDLEYYYDPNHINMWTKEMFESLMQRSGFEIVKQDHVMYGNSYLCKSSQKHVSDDVYKIDKDIVIDWLDKVKKTFDAYIEQDYKKALSIWPNFPVAHVANAELERKNLAEKGWDWFKENIIDKAASECPDSVEIQILATDFALRAKKYKEAIVYANTALGMKPNNPGSISQLINIFEQMAIKSKDENEKIGHFKQAKQLALHLMNTSMQNQNDAISKVYFLNSLIHKEV